LRPAVYIPNLNGGERLIQALRSLETQDHTGDFDVVVVDNGSIDGSSEAVSRRFDSIQVLELARNIGFGPALNLAVNRYPGDPLIFVNNDVVCEPGFIRELLAAAQGWDGTVAGVLLKGTEPEVVDSAGVIVDQTLLGLDHLHGESLERLTHAPNPLGPTGGAGLYPNTAFAAVGGFDTNFFCYLEDVDLALRLRLAGFGCRLAGDARGTHHHSATLGAGSACKNELMGFGRGYTLRKYGVLRRPRRAVRALTAEAIICAGQALIDRNLAGIRGRWQGWKAARGVDVLAPPESAIRTMPLRRALSVRLARRTRLGGGA